MESNDESNDKNENGKNLPEKKFRAGGVCATVWKNNGTNKKTGDVISYNTIQIDRRYKDKQGTWQSSSSMRLNDLPKAELVLHKAFEYLVLRGQDPLAAEEAEEGYIY